MTAKSQRLVLVVIAGLVAAALYVLLLNYRFFEADHVWMKESLHATMEAVGVMAAVFLAIFLLNREKQGAGRDLTWVGLGLLGMGLIDGFHAISSPGHGFFLLRGVAGLVGGLGFALVWTLGREGSSALKRFGPWGVAMACALLGVVILSARGLFPVMVQEGRFTSTAISINLLGGVLFLAAALRFLLDHWRLGAGRDFLFGCLALLFGLSGLLFAASTPWGETWWLGHFMRLAAYAVVCVFILREYAGMNKELWTHRDRLEELVTLRTEDLRASEEMNRATLYSIGDGVISTDIQGRVRQMNPVAELLTGWNEAEALGKPASEVFRIINEETRAEVESPVVRVLREGMIVGLANHTLLIAKNGIERPIADAGAPIRGAQGETSGVVLIFRDQTMERKAERALRESEARFRALVEHLPHKIFVKDHESTYIMCNPNYATDLGITPDEIAGKTDFEFYPEDLAEKYRADDHRVMVSGQIEDIEEPYVVDGQNRWAHTAKVPFRDENGAVVGVLGIFEDITERKEAEERFREEEMKVSTFLDNTTDLVTVVDAEGRLTYVNNASETILGMKPDEMIGQLAFGYIHPEDRETTQKAFGQWLQDRVTHASWENRQVTKTGEAHDMLWTIMPRYKDGALESIWSIARDITERKEAEEALRVSEELHRATLYSIGDGVISTDVQGRVRQMNPVAELLTGWTEVGARGKDIAEVFRIISEETRAEVESPVVRVLREGTIVGLANHTLLIAKDGTERPIADAGAPIRGAQGETSGVVLVFRDQTAERKADRALRESERKFRETVLHLDEAYYRCTLDGLLLDHNLAFNRILGFPLDQDMKGSKLPDFWQNPEARQEYINELMGQGVVTGFPIPAKTRDGEKIVVLASAHLVKDEQGRTEQIEGTFLDITARVRAEEELQRHRAELEVLVKERSEQLYLSEQRLAQESSAVAEIIGEMLNERLSDEETERQVLSACLEATGSVYGLIGRINEHGRFDTTAYGSRTLEDCAFPEALAWERSTGMEIRGVWGWPMEHGEPLICNDLTTHPARVGLPEGHIPLGSFLGVPIHEGGRTVGMVAVADRKGGYTDADVGTLARLVNVMTVSKRHRELLAEAKAFGVELERRVEERTAQLEASNKELEAFSYSVSHDLRAPLRAIDGFTRILVEDYESQLDDEGKRVCNIVRDNTVKMGQLIDDLLAFSRLGRAEMNPASIDMKQMVQATFNELTTPENQVRIDFKIDNDIPPAFGDASLMRQVWTNLLSNAVKFSAKRNRSVIEVRGEQRDGEMCYTVQDNGAGFDMRYADKLFGVFQRLHSSREFEGTGVGLALVARVIRRHGGQVWAEAEVDRGATFHFTLPQKGA